MARIFVCTKIVHRGARQIYMQNKTLSVSPSVAFHFGVAGAVHAIPNTQTHLLTRYCDGAVSGKFNARDVTEVGREGVQVGPRVDVPHYQVVVARTGDHLTFIWYWDGNAGYSVCVTDQDLESNYNTEITAARLLITWDSLPPTTCHTFNDISREPVMTYCESIVSTKQVISSEWLTVYFSSSLFKDHIFKLVSAFVAN